MTSRHALRRAGLTVDLSHSLCQCKNRLQPPCPRPVFGTVRHTSGSAAAAVPLSACRLCPCLQSHGRRGVWSLWCRTCTVHSRVMPLMQQWPGCCYPGLSLRPSNHVAAAHCKAQNVVFKVEFSTQWWPLSTLDPARMLHRHDTDVGAKFRRRTLRRFRAYRIHTLRQLSIIIIDILMLKCSYMFCAFVFTARQHSLLC